jgi:hypothetical protein
MSIRLWLERSGGGRARGTPQTVEAEIDSLLREKEEIEKWAAVGSP